MAADVASGAEKVAPQETGRTWFVTRHEGAREWAQRRGIANVQMVSHLDTAAIRPGDVVIGTLPVHLAAEVCARGGRYWHLTMDVPSEARGRELTADDMERFGARLEEFEVKRVASNRMDD